MSTAGPKTGVGNGNVVPVVDAIVIADGELRQDAIVTADGEIRMAIETTDSIEGRR